MPARSSFTRWASRLLPIAVLAAGVLGFVLLSASKPQLAPNDPEEKVWLVRAALPEITIVQPELVFYGQIVAGREVELRPLVSGRIVQVHPAFREGGKVAAGDVLIAVDDFNYEAAVAEARAELAEAEAHLSELQTDLENANAMLERERTQEVLRKRDAERFANLRDKGAASSKAYDDARMALLDSASRVVEREFAIKKWEATNQRQQAVVERLTVQLDRAQRDLADTELKAPFGGYLADIGTELGKQVSQADRVARLIDADELEVRFHVSGQRFGELMQDGNIEGRPVQIIWRLQNTALAYAGEIERIGAEIDPASGGMDMFASVDRGDAMQLLRPGAFVEVRMAGPRYSGVVRLPESAWHEDHIYVVKDGRLVERKADLVRRLGHDVLLRGDFATLDPILITPIPGVSAGLRVKLVEEDV
jgi:membrane fusion protein, multidrug efflux system